MHRRYHVQTASTATISQWEEQQTQPLDHGKFGLGREKGHSVEAHLHDMVAYPLGCSAQLCLGTDLGNFKL